MDADAISVPYAWLTDIKQMCVVLCAPKSVFGVNVLVLDKHRHQQWSGHNCDVIMQCSPQNTHTHTSTPHMTCPPV